MFDNKSADEIVKYVSEKYKSVSIINSEENIGFGRGNNAAIKHGSSPYILLLNPDAFISDVSQIDALVDEMEGDARIAAVGPRLINADGSHQTGDGGWKTSLTSALGHAFLLHRLLGFWPGFYITNPALLKRERVDLDWVCGACMLVRRSTWDEIGGFDESIFMYGEDVEWGERARSHGWSIRYLPGVSVTHLQGATQRKETDQFFSTKWLDSRYKRLESGRSRAAALAYKLILFLGFAGQAAAGGALALITRKDRGRVSALHKWRYARHALLAAPK